MGGPDQQSPSLVDVIPATVGRPSSSVEGPTSKETAETSGVVIKESTPAQGNWQWQHEFDIAEYFKDIGAAGCQPLCTEKSSWPELVGTDGEEAMTNIRREDSIITFDLRPEKVRE